ncbi:MAG TPA: tRNA (cytidine(34)-2'-O)-methyltransferase [Oligoflexia bacterium]|nr:tRNA (cytidine(34)-2'-O)-methyltransferase [Oligoflexia bacterium]HMR25391.1 tRNA (cytidine(34)-2'-O)-methyltransferase [Oligoflexia bacterium]
MLEVALVHPQIPWNTGNVGRTCVATQTKLHLVKPLGFDLDDKKMKRAGLDYWPNLDLQLHASLEDFKNYLEQNNKRPVLFSRFAQKSYLQFSYQDNDVLIFGSETQGLPQDFKKTYENLLLNIPTPGQVRSLNLSTSMAIALFEARRQLF